MKYSKIYYCNLMKVICLLLIFFYCPYLYSQNNSQPFELKQGLYGIKNKIDSNAYSLWYFKTDSTFINIRRSTDHKIGFIRMGKWHYLGDSMLSFKYKPLKSTLLLNSVIDYHAETKGSADSVYFNIVLKGPKCSYPDFCGIILDNEKKEFARFGESVGFGFQGLGANENGVLIFAIHKRIYYGSFGISSYPYYPLTINTFPNNNYHTLVINVPLKDSNNNVDLSKFNDIPEVLRYGPAKPGHKRGVYDRDLLINFITGDRTPLLEILYAARQRQPYLSGPIDELIDFLKKE